MQHFKTQCSEKAEHTGFVSEPKKGIHIKQKTSLLKICQNLSFSKIYNAVLIHSKAYLYFKAQACFS